MSFKRFSIVRASGSSYEVGVVIGKQMKAPICELLKKNKTLFQKNFPEFLEKSNTFLEIAQKYFPQYVKELRGISDGSGVPLDELFLSNNREVADYNPIFINSGHCTIVAVPTAGGYIVGHNEDWDQSSLSLLYILDATINGTRIFGLNYANAIIGDSIAINQYGIVQAINELYHQDAQLGVPKNFIARAVLDCRSLEEVQKLIETIPRAAGWNHVFVQRDRLWNIESSAKIQEIEKVELTPYAHTNHYTTRLANMDIRPKEFMEESRARLKKAKDFLSGTNSVSAIKNLLVNKEYPAICKDVTIASVIFDIPEKTAHIAYGRPTPSSYVEYSIGHVVE